MFIYINFKFDFVSSDNLNHCYVFIDLTKGIACASHFIRLSRSVKADLNMWKSFLDDFNGRSFFLADNWSTSCSFNLYTDAAAGCGFGAIFGRFWSYGEWLDQWKTLNIVILEFYPIVLSVLLWGHFMQNQRIIFFTDNAALVDIINKATSRDPTVMIFVRRLVLAWLRFNILFQAQHVPGVKNSLADSLSRLQVSGPVQAASTSGRASDSDNYTGTSIATQLAAIMSTLLQSSLQPSSIPTYRMATLFSFFPICAGHSSYFDAIDAIKPRLVYCLHVPT